MPSAKPARVKELAGNPGHRPIRKGPEPGPLSLRAPNGMPEGARREWRRVVPLLVRMGVAGDVDRLALADYCLCVARLAQCEREIEEHGVLVKGDRGLVKNPACQLAREYRAAVVRWSAEFGLTPSARGRIDAPAAAEVDPFAAYLQGSGVVAGLDDQTPVVKEKATGGQSD